MKRVHLHCLRFGQRRGTYKRPLVASLRSGLRLASASFHANRLWEQTAADAYMECDTRYRHKNRRIDCRNPIHASMQFSSFFAPSGVLMHLVLSGPQFIIPVQFGCSACLFFCYLSECLSDNDCVARLRYLDVFLVHSVCCQCMSWSHRCRLSSEEQCATSHPHFRLSSLTETDAEKRRQTRTQ